MAGFRCGKSEEIANGGVFCVELIWMYFTDVLGWYEPKGIIYEGNKSLETVTVRCLGCSWALLYILKVCCVFFFSVCEDFALVQTEVVGLDEDRMKWKNSFLKGEGITFLAHRSLMNWFPFPNMNLICK